jgi:glycosyltransferase involved in cell wall biosynthesis
VLRSFVPKVPALLSPIATEVQAARPMPKGHRVAFIGNFDHAPNRDALDWVLAEIWPRLRHAMPEAELHVAGPNLPHEVAGRRDDGVVVRCFVPDLNAFFGEAQIALVPYRFGGGTKIKALDAMARGCPVVATTIGAEGLQATPGVHLRVADDAAAFAREALDLLRSEPARRTQAEAARLHLTRHFSWDAKVGTLVELVHGLQVRRNGVAAAPTWRESVAAPGVRG